MSSKRNRKPAGRSPDGRAAREGAGGRKPRGGARGTAASRRAGAGEGSRRSGSAPMERPDMPPIRVSLGRGLLSTMGSLPIAIVAFASILLLWSGFAASGGGSAPVAMSEFLSLPPLHNALDSYFQLVLAGRAGSAVVTIALAGALLVFRAALMVILVALIRSAQEHPGRWREAFALAASLLRTRFLTTLAVEAVFLFLAVASFVIALGIIGLPGLVLALLGILYFLVYAPVAAILEGLPVRDAARTAYRIARLPGTGHPTMVSVYALLVIVLALLAPRAQVIQATPSVLVWVYSLFASLLQVSMLSALVHRWPSLRDAVLDPGAPTVEAAEETPRRVSDDPAPAP